MTTKTLYATVVFICFLIILLTSIDSHRTNKAKIIHEFVNNLPQGSYYSKGHIYLSVCTKDTSYNTIIY